MSGDGDGALGITREAVGAAFAARYRAVYGRTLTGVPVRLLNLRVTVIGRRPKFDLSILAPDPGATMAAARRGDRPVYVDGGWHDARVYDRMALPVGAVVPGPAVLEQADATIFIEPDLQGLVDRLGNVVITRKDPP